jgi:hypothetical protein
MLIHMVQAPEHRLPDDPACWVGLDRRSRSARRPLTQPPMGTPRIEVGDVFLQDALQMPLVDNQHLIQTLVPHRSDPPLRERVRPRRLYRCAELSHSQSTQTPIKRFAIPAVPLFFSPGPVKPFRQAKDGRESSVIRWTGKAIAAWFTPRAA